MLSFTSTDPQSLAIQVPNEARFGTYFFRRVKKLPNNSATYLSFSPNNSSTYLSRQAHWASATDIVASSDSGASVHA